GFVYRFELDAVGKVEVELGFDGLRRRYIRDKAGRVTKVFRPANRTTEYAYDEAGRMVGARHDTGEAEAFAYRADGELIEAANGSAVVTLERDRLGRVVKEVVGDDWVASDYDALGMRTRLRSSKGLDHRITRDAAGRAIGIRATVGGSGASAEAWEARVTRDVLGLEIERSLPGGVKARWERDAVGRPVRQEVSATGEFRRAVQYTWDVSDRLRMVIDATRGPTKYEHDALGNLAAATYADGRFDLRLPDAVGNLFRTRDRSDRKYGPAGQLLEARHEDGRVTRYAYDGEGNLVKKIDLPPGAVVDAEGQAWSYQWNGAGLLAKVVRPDGDEVTFAYDAMGRRLSKTFRARTTRWIWDANVPLHEWVEQGAAPPPMVDARSTENVDLDESADRRLKAERAGRPSLGPPDRSAPERGTAARPVTWLFDPETFAPAAKLVGSARYAIVTDHLGTPAAMYDEAAAEVWSAAIDAYGDLREVTGDRFACPFRWPGQYQDEETGLYYNRWRYYDATTGEYCSQDPASLA
ncbi:MAG TPA: RHS repeat-associated core domain-containing protein, partial [Nocardioidaceae bacterium]|nr:RHS repeat-associated core domain-containing protein [Nocardioidaceae bacterium]